MAAKDYNQLVKAQIGWRGAYPLIVTMHVGDYFQFDKDGVPVALGNILKWPGWADQLPVNDGEKRSAETWYGECTREKGGDATGGVTSPYGLGAEAGVKLTFKTSSSFALAYQNATVYRFEDVPTAQRAVLSGVDQGWWDPAWVLITHVMAAESASLLVSTQAGSTVNLSANAKIPDLGAVNIADPTFGWTASGWSGGGYTSLCQAGTPLYRCTKIKKGWFKSKVEEMGLDAAELDEVFNDGEDIFD